MNPDLLSYMKKQLKKGVKHEDIEKELLKGNHTKEEISRHFLLIDKQDAKSVGVKVKESIPPKALLVAAVIVVCFFAWYYWPESPDEPLAPAIPLNPLERDEGLLKNALIAGDLAMCDDITREIIKVDCKRALTPSEVTCDYECEQENYYKLALINDDKTLCDKIDDSSRKEACLGKFS